MPDEVIRRTMPDAKPCKHCGGQSYVELRVFRSGYSCGGGYDHADDCAVFFCVHGHDERADAECDACHDEWNAEVDEESEAS